MPGSIKPRMLKSVIGADPEQIETIWIPQDSGRSSDKHLGAVIKC